VVHLTMHLRPDSAWVGGRPTFDVRREGLVVYHPSLQAHREDTLSVQTYSTMVSLIPDEAEWAEDCRPGVRNLNQWMWAHGRPFRRLIAGLVGICEASLMQNARGLTRRGPTELPSSVTAWAGRNGCSIGNDSRGNANAAKGQFLPEDREQWAVLCDTGSAWRLLIVDVETGEEIAELTRMSGSADGWAIAVVPPEFFFWSPLGRSDNDPQRLPDPTRDAVIFTEGAWTVFYFESGQWRGVQNDCCYFSY